MTIKTKTIGFQGQNLKTFDMGLSVALLTCGYKMLDLDKTNPKRVLFVFRRSPGLDRDIGKYWSGDLLLDARTLFDNLKMIKNRLYSV